MLNNFFYTKIFVAIILSCVIITIGYAFWHQEFKYQLPTPRPPNLKKTIYGIYIKHPSLTKNSNKPIFLHFFNPSCPCSRFNSKHVRQLIKKYNAEVDFKIVISAKGKSDLTKDFFEINTEIIIDTNGTLAKVCGVYSTPQAVILTSKHKLFYSGNYNKTRYCTTKNTNYAENSLDALLANNYNFVPTPTIAYGCSLFDLNQ